MCLNFFHRSGLIFFTLRAAKHYPSPELDLEWRRSQIQKLSTRPSKTCRFHHHKTKLFSTTAPYLFKLNYYSHQHKLDPIFLLHYSKNQKSHYQNTLHSPLEQVYLFLPPIAHLQPSSSNVLRSTGFPSSLHCITCRQRSCHQLRRNCKPSLHFKMTVLTEMNSVPALAATARAYESSPVISLMQFVWSQHSISALLVYIWILADGKIVPV